MRNKIHHVIILFTLALFVSPLLQASSDLDYGLHWFGFGNTSIKAEAGVTNQNFDSSKPTVIYVHGWQNGSTASGKRETFNYLANDATYGIDVDTADAWIANGWNIGIFYWNQFADESEVKDAEAKIWSANGPRGMRYNTTSGYSTSANINVSASQLFFDSIVAAMPNYTGNNFRIAGHSLGNQMAVAVTEKLANAVSNGVISANLLPSRVALLDPFYSKGSKSYLNGLWTGEKARQIVPDLKNMGVLFEYYQTSGITDLWVGDKNEGLKDMCAYNSVAPWYIPSWGIAEKHIAAPNLYFLSYSADAPEEVTINWWGRRRATGKDALSASTSDKRLNEMMNSNYRWVQVEGRYTQTADDDQYERKNK